MNVVYGPIDFETLQRDGPNPSPYQLFPLARPC